MKPDFLQQVSRTLGFIYPVSVLMAAFLLSGCLPPSGSSDEATGPDPGIIDFPIAYVKRPYPVDNQGNIEQPDLQDPLQFSVGGDLYIRTRASLSASETNITGAITGGQGDVRDVDVSFDGTKMVFSLREFDPNPNNPPTPKWNIYELDLLTQTVSLVMSQGISDQGNDIEPHYLPDGRIIFSSDRQKGSRDVLLSEGKETFSAMEEGEDTKAFVLHIMDENGNNIEQISYNPSHDLNPVVLDDGRILFTRWDNAGPGTGGMHLYTINPDGSNQQLLYGGYSHDTGTNGSTIQFVKARPMPGGGVMAIIQPFNGTFGGGDIVRIDVDTYIDNDQALALYGGSMTGPAQVSATVNTILTDGSPSPGGRYSAAYPLWDGSDRMLVSKGFCNLDVAGTPRACIEPYLSDPAAQETPPEYSIWMYDLSGDTEKPVVPAETGIIITDVVVAQPRNNPAIAGGSQFNTDWESDGVGALHIRSVYDFDGTYNSLGAAATNTTEMATSTNLDDQRPARFLRLVKAVGLPDPDDEDLTDPPDLAREAFGPNRQLGMKEILGYAPIEPDGSVMVKVPANVAFNIEVLDENGARISQRHDNWMQVRAGETIECNGCHVPPTQNGPTPLPHGRANAQATAVNQGAGTSLPLDLPTGLKTVPFLYAQNGETMAQVRYKRCNLDGVLCDLTTSNIDPSVDVLYTDTWTDPADASVMVNSPLTFSYAALQAAGEIFDPAAAVPLSPPTSNSCQTAWDNKCRILIHYEDHIHPLWAKPRGAMDADTCTNCHSTRANDDPADLIQVPAGQLNLSDNNLTDDPTIVDNGQKHAYRELLFTDTELELNAAGTALQERLISVDSGTVDPVTGDPIFIDVPVNVTPSMSANGANSGRFMTKMRSTAGTVDHSLLMSPSELRLVTEWLDIGAQYFNNPFDPRAPQN